jgi:hypothetical protein
MRSDLVFGALANVPNRFLLTKLASQATRRLHRPNTRIQETENDVFVRFHRTNPIADARGSQQYAAVGPHRATGKLIYSANPKPYVALDSMDGAA